MHCIIIAPSIYSPHPSHAYRSIEEILHVPLLGNQASLICLRTRRELPPLQPHANNSTNRKDAFLGKALMLLLQPSLGDHPLLS